MTEVGTPLPIANWLWIGEELDPDIDWLSPCGAGESLRRASGHFALKRVGPLYRFPHCCETHP